MAYRVRGDGRGESRHSIWRLPNVVIVEARLRLQQLQSNPGDLLIRAQQPFDGMVYFFEFIDPANRLHQYQFLLHIEYAQDEQSVVVVTGVYVPRFVGD